MSGEDEVLAPSVAERYVVGALISDGAVLRAVQQEVAPQDFGDLRLGDIFSGIAGMLTRGEPVDYLTVWDNLAAWGVRGIELQDLAHWAQAVPSPQSAPYYARIVRNGAERRALAVLAGQLQQAENTGRAIAHGLEVLRDLQGHGASRAKVPLRTLEQVLDVPPEEDAYDWVVGGLLERRDRLMLTGSEGGGKSTLLRQLGVMTAGGLHPFSAQEVRPMRVLVIDAENSERQWRRAVTPLVQAVQQYGQNPVRNLFLHVETEQVDITRASDLGRFHQYIDEARPDLLLIGPLYKLVPRAIKDDDDAAPVLAALDSLRERDIAMLIEAHAGHADGRTGVRDLRPRGSSALLGWPEFGLGLAKPQKPGDPFKLLRWRGDRDERYWPTTLNAARNTPGQPFPWWPTGQYFMPESPADEQKLQQQLI